MKLPPPLKPHSSEFLRKACQGFALAAIVIVPSMDSAIAAPKPKVVPPTPVATVEHDLSAVGSQQVIVTGDFGGNAIFADYFEQPTGTGVFEPFLTLDSNGQTSTGNTSIEQAYNTDGSNALYLDQLRPHWNTLLKVSDLATITLNSVDYFGFILDANEPGAGDKDLISVDNIRIYTSAVDSTASVGNNTSQLNNLGTLRWAMNNPLLGAPNQFDGFNVDTWVKLDASQENVDQGGNSNGGSGKGDMVVYIPTTAFGNSLGTQDYVWFYNLNGVHYSTDRDLSSQAGFEEWRAVTRLRPQSSVPDGGSSLLLLGLSLGGLKFLRNFQKSSKKLDKPNSELS